MLQYLNQDEKNKLANNQNEVKEKDDSELDLMQRIAKKQMLGQLKPSTMSLSNESDSMNMVGDKKDIKRVKTNDFYNQDDKKPAKQKNKVVIDSDEDISEDSDSYNSDDSFVYDPKEKQDTSKPYVSKRTKNHTKTAMIEECSDDDDEFYL